MSMVGRVYLERGLPVTVLVRWSGGSTGSREMDLDKLGADNVNIVDDKVIISLPAVEILSVDLENIEVYDIQTGSFNLLPMDKSVFKTVQEEAKRQVLQSACKAEILEHANRQAQMQLENLFALTQTKVSVYPAAVGKCG